MLSREDGFFSILPSFAVRTNHHINRPGWRPLGCRVRTLIYNLNRLIEKMVWLTGESFSCRGQINCCTSRLTSVIYCLRTYLAGNIFQQDALRCFRRSKTGKFHFASIGGSIVDISIINAPNSTKNKKKLCDPQRPQTRKGNLWCVFGNLLMARKALLRKQAV